MPRGMICVARYVMLAVHLRYKSLDYFDVKVYVVVCDGTEHVTDSFRR